MALRARRADVEIRAQTRKYKRDLAKAKKETKGFAKSASKSLRAGFAGGFGAVAALGTAGGLADIGQDVLAFEEGLTRLKIQAKGKADIPGIRKEVGALSMEFGLGKTAILDAANALTNRLGGEAATTEKIRALTEAHVASGAAMEDLALLALKLDKAFGLRSADEMRAGLSALIEVGKEGSVPLAEMATVIAQTGSQFARFGKTGKEAAAELGALIQVAVAGGEAGGFGTAAEAGTGLRAFISQLESSEDKLRAVGVRVREVGKDGQKRFLPMADILEQIRKKNLINRRGFVQMFGSVQARDFLAVLLEGEGAVRKLTAAGVKSNASQADAQMFMESAAGRSRKAMMRLKNEIAKVFTPERIEKMIAAADALGTALGFVIDHWKLFLAGFLALKAGQIGRSLMRWSRASRGLASNLGDVATQAQRAGKSGKGLDGASRKAGRGRRLAGALGPEIAFVAGEMAGQYLGEKAVEERKGRFAERKKEQRAALSRNEMVSQAVLTLTDADVVDEMGQLRADFEKELMRAVSSGRKLTELQRNALTALTGVQSVGAASAGIFSSTSGVGEIDVSRMKKMMAEGMGVFDAMAASRGPRQLVTAASGITPEQAREQLAADAMREMGAVFMAGVREIVSSQENRPVEVSVDGNVVARTNQRAAVNRRSPAP